MLERTQGRRRALEVLFAAEAVGEDPRSVASGRPDLPGYARELVEGIAGIRGEIDGLIRAYAERWELERMPAVDRNLLRIGVYEILRRPDVPVGATINDCVELAKMLSTADSGRFVNGILGRLARERRTE